MYRSKHIDDTNHTIVNEHNNEKLDISSISIRPIVAMQEIFDSFQLNDELDTVTQMTQSYLDDNNQKSNDFRIRSRNKSSNTINRDNSPIGYRIGYDNATIGKKLGKEQSVERTNVKSTSRSSIKATLPHSLHTANTFNTTFLSTIHKSRPNLSTNTKSILNTTAATLTNTHTILQPKRSYTPIEQYQQQQYQQHNQSLLENNKHNISFTNRKNSSRSKTPIRGNVLENSWLNDAESIKSTIINAKRGILFSNDKRQTPRSQHSFYNEQESIKRRVMDFLKPSRVRFTKCLRVGDRAGCAKEIIDTMQTAVNEDLLEILIHSLRMLANMYFALKKWDEAIIYYNQHLCELTGYSKKKLDAYIKLAECARCLEKYSEAIHILRVGLQYAWHKNIKDLELKIYDEMGIIYYYFGELQKARFYHTKAVENIHEQPQSQSRKLYEAEYKNLQKPYIPKYKNICTQLLSKLNLPVTLDIPRETKLLSGDSSLKSIESIESKEEDLRQYNKAKLKGSAQTLIDTLLKEYEFCCRLPSPRMGNADNKQVNINQKEFKIFLAQQKHRNHSEMANESSNGIPKENTIREYEKILKERKNIIIDKEKIWSDIRKEIYQSTHHIEAKDRILLNHLDPNRHLPDVEDIKANEVDLKVAGGYLKVNKENLKASEENLLANEGSLKGNLEDIKANEMDLMIDG